MYLHNFSFLYDVPNFIFGNNLSPKTGKLLSSTGA